MTAAYAFRSDTGALRHDGEMSVRAGAGTVEDDAWLVVEERQYVSGMSGLVTGTQYDTAH